MLNDSTDEGKYMKNEDAAKILGIDGELSPEIVKQAYRRACSKYHPDRNPAGEEMMKAVNVAFEQLRDFEGALSSGSQGYDEAMNNVLNELLKMVGIHIEVCGAWIWVSGNTKPYKDILGKDGLGFYWASKKQSWYFRPDDWKSSARGNWSMDKIRTEHGSQVIRGTPRYNNMLA